MVEAPDGGWAMEFKAGPDGRFKVSYDRVGGIVRITGAALLRQPTGDVSQPITIVMRVKDAQNLAPAMLGTVNRLF